VSKDQPAVRQPEEIKGQINALHDKLDELRETASRAFQIT
jgi:hypothetical protein